MRLCDWGLFVTEDATSNTKFKFRQIRPNRQDAIALDSCAMHVWFSKLEFRLLRYIHVDNISTQTQQISYKVHTTTVLLNFGQFWRPCLDTFRACIVQFISDYTNWSEQTSFMHQWGRHINSNLGYVIWSSYDTTLLSHLQIKICLIRAHLVLV